MEPRPARPARHALRDGLARPDRTLGPSGDASSPRERGERARSARAPSPGSRAVGGQPGPWCYRGSRRRRRGRRARPGVRRPPSPGQRHLGGGADPARALPGLGEPPAEPRRRRDRRGAVLATRARRRRRARRHGRVRDLAAGRRRTRAPRHRLRPLAAPEAAPLHGAHLPGRAEPPRVAPPARGGRAGRVRRHAGPSASCPRGSDAGGGDPRRGRRPRPHDPGAPCRHHVASLLPVRLGSHEDGGRCPAPGGDRESGGDARADRVAPGSRDPATAVASGGARRRDRARARSDGGAPSPRRRREPGDVSPAGRALRGRLHRGGPGSLSGALPELSRARRIR